MQQTRSRLTPVGDEPAEFEAAVGIGSPPPPSRTESALTGVLMLSLRTLSQRALAAIADLFTLVLAASVWWLFYETLPSPTTAQLVGLGVYCLFVLALHLIRQRR